MMKTKFEDFINEYRTPLGYDDNDKIEVANKFLNTIINQPKKNIKETILYKWLKAKSIPYTDFISVINNIYDLDINFNQSLVNSDDFLIKKLEKLWIDFNYKPLEFFDFKNKLMKIIR